ncbi:YqgE/AlgH family protein [Pseudoalteromonas sp. J010]|uniref:YqgE/AlgH family protein n=1 Tax=Pseudoalteromonas TaxID=53246 RepID=UPI000F6508BB|nr:MULTISPECIES: YqgE/AlgH family protein [Pseudoalteromonas]MDW7549563.1 YqgE/AlgH family protein [Pseudoalteromonas peptidolytica]RRS10618.1 YqgE/AlgH family protein [Pseudoalteromonas sp. J010]
MKSLANHFLIAMPSMDDPFFNHTVTYLCEHNEDGAMGLVVNHPIDVTVGELLDQIDIDNDKSSQTSKVKIYAGGPVHTDRGFVLHTPKLGYASSQELSSDIMITTSKDVLASLTSPQSPEGFIITLGYAGWVQGQLEKELKENTWLVVEANPEIIFNTPPEKRWEKAVQMLGIDVAQLSSQAGHA